MEKGYLASKDFSDRKLAVIRDELTSLSPEDGAIITCGSYARREASETSDLDYFTVYKNDVDVAANAAQADNIRSAILKHVQKLPAADGAFARDVSKEELLANFGGSKDTNETITRRMLVLLEGEFLTGEKEFNEIRTEIIKRYVRQTPKDHQLAFYLLNDMIRYWRTMAVDYANKTDPDADEPKPWATRNIKLVFSRKLIYASGLFSVALTADRQEQSKCDLLSMMFSMTPIERIQYVCGADVSKRLLQIYDLFLNEMSKNSVRTHLDNLTREKRDDDTMFRYLKNEGHYFSRELMGLFHRTFHSSHPIHMAVVF